MTHTHHETLSDRRTAPLDRNPKTLHALNYEPTTLNRNITFDISTQIDRLKYHHPRMTPRQPTGITVHLGPSQKNSGAFFDPLPTRHGPPTKSQHDNSTN